MLKKHKERNFYLPVVNFKSLDDFAQQAGTTVPEIMPLVRRDVDAYRDFELRNPQTGKIRSISAPTQLLMNVQRTALKGMRTTPSYSPHAYIRGRSIITAAKQHPNAVTGFKLDISDYFHSISEAKILESWWWNSLDKLPRHQEELVRAFAALATRNKPNCSGSPLDTYLPQGAPTSGFMSNIVGRHIDVSMWKIARRFGMRSTRYSDDILFTSRLPLSRQHLETALHEARGAIISHGFEVNDSKTRILTQGSRMEVLGVMLGGETPRLSRTKRRKIESEIRGIVKFGLLSHALERHRNPDALYQSLRGYLAFAYPLEKEWAGRQIALLQSAVKDLYASN